MPITAERRTLIDAIGRVLTADNDVEAAWLAGSLGRGEGDPLSDVDVLVLAADGKLSGIVARYVREIPIIAEPALVNSLFGGRVLNVITLEWRRFDLTFLEEGVGPTERGGALHRKPLLTSAQQREFESLAPVVADRAGIISASVALAELFLPRARRLAARIGMVWPDAFEMATRRHLKERLDLSLG